MPEKVSGLNQSISDFSIGKFTTGVVEQAGLGRDKAESDGESSEICIIAQIKFREKSGSVSVYRLNAKVVGVCNLPVGLA